MIIVLFFFSMNLILIPDLTILQSSTIKHFKILMFYVHSQGPPGATDQINEIVNPVIGSNTPVPNDPIMPVLAEGVLPPPAYSVPQYSIINYNIPQEHWPEVVLPPEVIFILVIFFTLYDFTYITNVSLSIMK